MANQVSLEPLHYKKLVLKVSIDCEGCRKRVNRILTKVPGVEKVDINMKQQIVTVVGDVDAFYVLKKLKRSGRQVELLPEIKLDQKTEKKPEKSKDKEKQPKLEVKGEASRTTGADGGNNNDKFAADKPQLQANANSPKESAKSSQISSGDGDSETAAIPVDEEKSDVSAAEVRQDSSKERKITEQLEKESKPEGKIQENDTAGGEPSSAAEEKDDVEKKTGTITSKKVDSGNGGNKKKKKGQNRNNNGVVPSSLSDVTSDHGIAPPTYSLPANHVLPRDLGYYSYERDLYSSPPVYAASYNTSHPSNYATTSYYTALPADSYVHAYSGGLGREISPSDVEAYSRQQPLDSLEMFSDENPNGCSIM